jgi:hypothetical protein
MVGSLVVGSMLAVFGLGTLGYVQRDTGDGR